jgi:hypothetical protein
MYKDIIEAAENYKKQHPEVDEIMRRFQMTQEIYRKALKAISVSVRKEGSTYGLTTEGRYNVNVSASN